MTSRIECDGTKKNGTRNCYTPATWQLMLKADADAESQAWWGACPQHLHQAATSILQGNQGELTVNRILTVEN